MNNTLPNISIVIPVLNGENDVKQCIKALLAQDYHKDNTEIIIVDNGSKDRTVEIATKLGIKCLKELRKGRSKALNTGVRESKGELILTTDISCVAEPDWVTQIVQSFNNPSIGCVAGEIKQLIRNCNFAINYQKRNNYMSPMHARNRKPPLLPFADGASASFRRQVFEEIGLFDDNFFKGADVEICYRMLTESNYKLEFNEDAIVWEEGEPSIYALLKQRFRMGVASNLFNKKFNALNTGDNDKNKHDIKKYYWSLRNEINIYISCLLSYINAIFKKEPFDIANDKLMRIGMSLAQRYGRVYGKIEQVINPEKYALKNPPFLDKSDS